MGQKRLENGVADNYMWCSFCGKTYKLTDYTIVKDKYGFPEIYMNHYQYCIGNEYGYKWRWETIRARHKNYPLIPQEGVVYLDMLIKKNYGNRIKNRKVVKPIQLKLFIQ